MSETNNSDSATCSPFWYGVGAFFVAPIAAIFCVLMGFLLALAWPFIPFLCYMQKKEAISKTNARIKPDSVLSRCFQCLVRRFVPEKALYYELLWAVESVHDGETRHETALRYITEKESDGDFNIPEVPNVSTNCQII